MSTKPSKQHFKLSLLIVTNMYVKFCHRLLIVSNMSESLEPIRFVLAFL